MSLSTKVMDAMKAAMKSKDSTALQALRAVKSELLLAQTESGAKQDLSEEQELKLLQKLVKQRKDSAAISVIFHGPDSYISPSNMATKQLPTWNYIKVHCKGEIQVIDDPTAMMETMIAMTSFLEGKGQA